MARNRQQPNSKEIGVLCFVHRYWQQHQISPTIREIGDASGTRSSSVVNYRLTRLEEIGCVVRYSRRSRAIVLTERARSYLDIDDKDVKEASPCPDHILKELHRLRTENAKLRRLKMSSTVLEQLDAQREQLERKHRKRIAELEQDRDQLVDALVRLQMRSAS